MKFNIEKYERALSVLTIIFPVFLGLGILVQETTIENIETQKDYLLIRYEDTWKNYNDYQEQKTRFIIVSSTLDTLKSLYNETSCMHNETENSYLLIEMIKEYNNSLKTYLISGLEALATPLYDDFVVPIDLIISWKKMNMTQINAEILIYLDKIQKRIDIMQRSRGFLEEETAMLRLYKYAFVYFMTAIQIFLSVLREYAHGRVQS